MNSKKFAATLVVSGILVSATALAVPDPLTDADFRTHRPALVELGRNLFFDKILSGNENISCATCHHTLTNTADGLSLPVGEGGHGLGINRVTGVGADAIVQRVPHNAPALFNMGVVGDLQFPFMFNDGRVAEDPSHPRGFISPAGEQLPLGMPNVVAVQALLPLTNPTEMAGHPGENTVADAAAANNLAGPASGPGRGAGRDPGGVWVQLVQRLRDIPAYVTLFANAFDEVDFAADITINHVGIAIAAFEETSFRADNSPFDRFLRGDRQAMSLNAQRGMNLFYNGKNGDGQACASCHSGSLQTDHDFHAIAMPQIGPGKGDGFTDSDGIGREDFGRGRINPADIYKFRTPSLRNIVLTAPYGHAGAYNTLRAVVEHHMNAVFALEHYDQSQAVLPSRADLDAIDFVVMNNPAVVADIAAANEMQLSGYSSEDIDHLIDFLHALTDSDSLDLRDITPESLPSGLPLAD